MSNDTEETTTRRAITPAERLEELNTKKQQKREELAVVTEQLKNGAMLTCEIDRADKCFGTARRVITVPDNRKPVQGKPRSEWPTREIDQFKLTKAAASKDRVQHIACIPCADSLQTTHKVPSFFFTVTAGMNRKRLIEEITSIGEQMKEIEQEQERLVRRAAERPSREKRIEDLFGPPKEKEYEPDETVAMAGPEGVILTGAFGKEDDEVSDEGSEKHEAVTVDVKHHDHKVAIS